MGPRSSRPRCFGRPANKRSALQPTELALDDQASNTHSHTHNRHRHALLPATFLPLLLHRSLPSPRPLSAVHSHIHTLVIAGGAVVLHRHAPQPATALTTSPHPTAIESPGVPRCVRGRQVVYWRQDRRRGGKVL